jgi:hypothetical protein
MNIQKKKKITSSFAYLFDSIIVRKSSKCLFVHDVLLTKMMTNEDKILIKTMWESEKSVANRLIS